MKLPGHPCPKCNALPCSEFAMLHQPPRWKCNSCGSDGLLGGTFTGRAPEAPKAARSMPRKRLMS